MDEVEKLIEAHPSAVLQEHGELGNSALMVAAGSPGADKGRLTRTQLVRRLLEAGADINEANEDGWTSLHHACSVGDMEVAQLLMERGANPRLRDQLGLSPADIAESAQGGGAAALTRIGRDGGASGGAPLALLRADSESDEAAFRRELKRKAEPVPGVHARVRCAAEVEAGDTIDVHYMCRGRNVPTNGGGGGGGGDDDIDPAAPLDLVSPEPDSFLQIYYVADGKAWHLLPRIGAYQ